MAYDPVHKNDALQIKGKWPKWSRYEVVNGVIVPAKDAELTEYDPWLMYNSNTDVYRTVKQPYLSLLELGRHLKKCEKAGIVPSKLDSRHSAVNPSRGPQKGADELVLDWCNTNGLLGLLPVLSTEIHVSDNVQHFRDGGRWFTSVTEEEVRGSITATHCRKESGEQDSVTPMVQADHKTSMTWLSWWRQIYERTPLGEMCTFFGAWSPTEAFTPCRPGSREFWLKYSEPVHQFADWCIVFLNAVDGLSRLGSRAAYDLDLVKAGHLVLNRLAESAAPRFELHPTRKIVLDEERVPAGLLASYALMFLWDVVGGRRALRCKNCDRYFVSDEHRAAYCSPRCRNTAQSRRYRSKKEAGR
jgi:hypothetical protein